MRAIAVGVAIAAVLVLLAAVALRHRSLGPAASPSAPPSPVVVSTRTATAAAKEPHPGFLYGRVTTDNGVFEGRLRWGRGEEAFWGDSFNGVRRANAWVSQVPPQRLPKERRPIVVFGVEIGHRERRLSLRRVFAARFGDITRIDSRGRDVVVTLKSGMSVTVDRHGASDFDDVVRVWDARRGVVDLNPRWIRAIELLPATPAGDAPTRLRGTVRTPQGEFTGFVQWDQMQCLGSDELHGRTADRAERTLRFDTIRSIARRAPDACRVTLLDGEEVVLSGTREVGPDHRGIFVDDRRYGRVRITWNAFERVDFSPAAGSGPAYGDFPVGRPLSGSVTTRDGRHLTGRLVYDLDESETTETLDAPSRGVDYTIPFGLIASIEAGVVTLHGGEQLRLERSGDLGDANAGMLVFVAGNARPEYVPWRDVQRVDLERPPAMYPPLPGGA